MRLIVTGCKDYTDWKRVWRELDSVIAELVEGGCGDVVIVGTGLMGAEMLGRVYALDNGYWHKEFRCDDCEDFDKEYAKYGDGVLIFGINYGVRSWAK